MWFVSRFLFEVDGNISPLGGATSFVLLSKDACLKKMLGIFLGADLLKRVDGLLCPSLAVGGMDLG